MSAAPVIGVGGVTVTIALHTLGTSPKRGLGTGILLQTEIDTVDQFIAVSQHLISQWILPT